MPFKALGLPLYLINALSENGIDQPYPIQIESIPSILSKKDVIGIAQTGSGKTESYVLPILKNLIGGIRSKNRHIKVLVIVPTRELAIQVCKVFDRYSKVLPEKVKTLAVFGGVSINVQMLELQGVSILVATPGRLLELVESNAVHLSDTETIVIDEADKMLNLGFRDEMNVLLNLLPKKRQNLLFSATLTDEITNINSVFFKNPIIIKVENKSDDLELIKQTAYLVTNEKKGPLLRYLINTNELNQILVFTSTVYSAINVTDKLLRNGITASSIHSKKSQLARIEALDSFKSGEIRVLVATDLLSRGIDIRFLPYVINYELPRSPKDFIHRIGRTGRAESTGEAISFITAADVHHFNIIQKKIKKEVLIIDSSSFNL